MITTLEHTVTYELYTPPETKIIPPELDEIVTITQDTSVQMLPLDGEKLASHQTAVVAKMGETIVGYCAGTYLYEQQGTPIMEVGALVVVPEHRHLGIAHQLVPAVTEQVHSLGYGAIAFCNPASTPIFQTAGYKVATLDQVPEEALGPCSICPMQALHSNGICCDDVYISLSDTNL